MAVKYDCVGEYCNIVAKGQCREITIACVSEEEASQVLETAVAWAEKYRQRMGKEIKCARKKTEVIICK